MFIRKVNLNDNDEVQLLLNTPDYDTSYILIHNYPSDPEERYKLNTECNAPKKGLDNLHENKLQLQEIMKNYNPQSPDQSTGKGKHKVGNCCPLGQQGKLCLCNYSLYQVRPYTYEILRAIQPFFEIVAVSNMYNYELEQIIDHIESVLNKPIIEMLIRQAKEKKELKQRDRDLEVASQNSNQSADSAKKLRQQI